MDRIIYYRLSVNHLSVKISEGRYIQDPSRTLWLPTGKTQMPK